MVSRNFRKVSLNSILELNIDCSSTLTKSERDISRELISRRFDLFNAIVALNRFPRIINCQISVKLIFTPFHARDLLSKYPRIETLRLTCIIAQDSFWRRFKKNLIVSNHDTDSGPVSDRDFHIGFVDAFAHHASSVHSIIQTCSESRNISSVSFVDLKIRNGVIEFVPHLPLKRISFFRLIHASTKSNSPIDYLSIQQTVFSWLNHYQDKIEELELVEPASVFGLDQFIDSTNKLCLPELRKLRIGFVSSVTFHDKPMYLLQEDCLKFVQHFIPQLESLSIEIHNQPSVFRFETSKIFGSHHRVLRLKSLKLEPCLFNSDSEFDNFLHHIPGIESLTLSQRCSTNLIFRDNHLRSLKTITLTFCEALENLLIEFSSSNCRIESIIIRDCHQLKRISISSDTLGSLSISRCTAVTQFFLKASSIQSMTLQRVAFGTIELVDCHSLVSLSIETPILGSNPRSAWDELFEKMLACLPALKMFRLTKSAVPVNFFIAHNNIERLFFKGCSVIMVEAGFCPKLENVSALDCDMLSDVRFESVDCLQAVDLSGSRNSNTISKKLAELYTDFEVMEKK